MGTIDLKLTNRAGRPTLSGGDLIRLALYRASFEPVAVYAPALAPQIARGTDADALLRTGEGIH
jgi:hypothetical protein